MGAACEANQPRPLRDQQFTPKLTPPIVIAHITNNDASSLLFSLVDMLTKCDNHGFSVLLFPSRMNEID